MPVLPDVGSIRVSPGFILPLFSASSIIRRAILSFTLPPALKYSHFARTVHSRPRDCGILLSLTRGVLPICSVIVDRMPWLNGRGVGDGAAAAIVQMSLCL